MRCWMPSISLLSWEVSVVLALAQTGSRGHRLAHNGSPGVALLTDVIAIAMPCLMLAHWI